MSEKFNRWCAWCNIKKLSNITCRLKHAALKWFFVVNQKIECHTSIRTPRKGLFNGRKMGRKIGLLDKFWEGFCNGFLFGCFVIALFKHIKPKLLKSNVRMTDSVSKKVIQGPLFWKVGWGGQRSNLPVLTWPRLLPSSPSRRRRLPRNFVQH